MYKKKKILFVYRDFFSFVKRDFEILDSQYNVTSLHATKNLPLLIFKLLALVPKNDLIFVWFADWHAFLATLSAKLFRKKIVVIVGGYDAACVPEINYGAFCSWWKSKVVKWTLKNVTIALAVSKHVEENMLKYSKPKGAEVLYHGFDYAKIKLRPQNKKENLVISVGTAKIKRPDIFIKVAKYLPKIKFLLVGSITKEIEQLQKIAPLNVKFTGLLSFDKLLKKYQKAKVYVQTSAYEGFGCALAEAMLCECVPVVTKKAALPEVIGNTGFCVPYGNAEATAEAIKKALISNKGKVARERIKKFFPISRRKKKLIEVIEKLK
ncbi:MAG: glycosyltransferase family 4 protein [Candidatus Pacearchaeota archaeon]|nr:MAG: glycosyltransferase family 4 protein [Candidatus Pacearchaeota archaeon]